MIVCFKNMLTI